jgi:hypothetical protein
MLGTTIRRRTARVAAGLTIALLGATALSGCIADAGPAPRPPQTQTRTFTDPQTGGRWLDVCYGHGSCREQQAINAYCQQQGFQRAQNAQSRVTPFGQQNMRIGDRSMCNSLVGNCHRVISVTCSRTV